MSTVTFVTKDGMFEITVKQEFVKQNPNYLEASYAELAGEKMNLHKYLHNPTGSAHTHLKTIDPATGKPKVEYWLDGDWVDPVDAEKIIHNNKFNIKFDQEILQD